MGNARYNAGHAALSPAYTYTKSALSGSCPAYYMSKPCCESH